MHNTRMLYVKISITETISSFVHRHQPFPSVCADGGPGRAHRASPAPGTVATPVRPTQPHGEHLHHAGITTGTAQAADWSRHVTQPGQRHQEWVSAFYRMDVESTVMRRMLMKFMKTECFVVLVVFCSLPPSFIIMDKVRKE